MDIIIGFLFFINGQGINETFCLKLEESTLSTFDFNRLLLLHVSNLDMQNWNFVNFLGDELRYEIDRMQE